MKFITLILMVILAFNVEASLQNEDFSSVAEMQAKGLTLEQAKNAMLHDSKIMVKANGLDKLLVDAIIDGDIGGSGEASISILENTTFDDGLTGWTATGITNPDVLPSELPGESMLCFNATAQPWSLFQDSTVGATAFASVMDGVRYIAVRSTHNAAVNVIARRAGADIPTESLLVRSVGEWDYYKLPTTLGPTSNGIKVEAASGTGATCVKDASVEVAKGYEAVKDLRTQIAAASASGTFSGTITTAPTITGDSLFSVSSGVYTALTDIEIVAGATIRAAGATASLITVVGPGGSTNAVDQTSATTGAFATATWSGKILTGETFFFSVGGGNSDLIRTNVVANRSPTSSVRTYTDQCKSDIECENDFSFNATSGGVVTENESSNYIQGNASVSGSVYTYTLNNLTSAPDCTCNFLGSSGSVKACHINSSSSSTLSIRMNTDDGGSAAITYVAAPHVVICKKTGTDYKAKRTITASFKDMVTSQGSGSGADIQSVYFGAGADCVTVCSTGTCTICKQVGNKISAVNFISTGQYDIVGIDGVSKYSCSANGDVGSGGFPGLNNPATSTSNSARVQFVLSSTLTNVRRTSVICTGVE